MKKKEYLNTFLNAFLAGMFIAIGGTAYISLSIIDSVIVGAVLFSTALPLNFHVRILFIHWKDRIFCRGPFKKKFLKSSDWSSWKCCRSSYIWNFAFKCNSEVA